MYAYIENNEIKQIGNAPTVWEMKDGSTVSGFNLLPDSILKDEGWLPVEEVMPAYNTETEQLANPTYEIQTDKVVKTYSIQPIQVVNESINNVPSLEDRVTAVEDTLTMMLGL